MAWPFEYLRDVVSFWADDEPSGQAIGYTVLLVIFTAIYPVFIHSIILNIVESTTGQLIQMGLASSGLQNSAIHLTQEYLIFGYTLFVYFVMAFIHSNSGPEIDDEKLEKAGLYYKRETPEVVEYKEDRMVLKAEGFPKGQFTKDDTKERFESVFHSSIISVDAAEEHGYDDATYYLQLGEKSLSPISYSEFANDVEPEEEQLFIGMNKARERITLKLEDATHIMIAGETGSGKSVCTKQIMTRLMETSPYLKIAINDLKGGVEFAEYVQSSENINVYDTRDEFVEFLEVIADEVLEKRLDELKKQGVRGLAELPNEDRQNMPRILIVMDEFAELLGGTKANSEKAQHINEMADQARMHISKIARMGRSAGVHLIMATQRPSSNIMDMQIRDNLPTRLVGCLPNQSMAQSLVDSKDPVEIPPKRGIMYYKRGGERGRVQVPFISNEEAIERIRKAAPNTAGAL